MAGKYKSTRHSCVKEWRLDRASKEGNDKPWAALACLPGMQEDPGPQWAGRHTCGGNAVKAHEGIEASRCPRQDTREPEGHESTNTGLPFFCVTRKKSHKCHVTRCTVWRKQLCSSLDTSGTWQSALPVTAARPWASDTESSHSMLTPWAQASLMFVAQAHKAAEYRPFQKHLLNND